MSAKIRVIPTNTNNSMKHVVIHARVSYNSMEQIDSLKTQISVISGHNNCKLIYIHIDIALSKKGSVSPVPKQMINKCKVGLTYIVVVNDISRLGIDTV